MPHSVPWIKELLDVIAPEEAFDNSWVQVYEPGGFHPIHNHAGSKISGSGCLFLTEGQSTYFQDPLHQSNTTTSKVKVGDILNLGPRDISFQSTCNGKKSNFSI